MEEDVFRRGVAEFIGTFTLIFIGGGAGIVSGQDIVAVALANGLAIGIMVTNLGHISGGHFNPAITLGFVATRRITLPLAVVYWISQFAGAIVAAAILRGCSSQHSLFLGAVPHAAEASAPARASSSRSSSPSSSSGPSSRPRSTRAARSSRSPASRSGSRSRSTCFMGGPLTGAAMNPARAFGPELLGNFWGEGWIYYLGPAIGALIAALRVRLSLPAPLRRRRRHPESGVASRARRHALD